MKASVAQYRQENPDYTGPIPADAVTASASGLDPAHQPGERRRSRRRAWRAPGASSPTQVRAVVGELTEGRWLGFIGEPRVNVLQLNLALDERFGQVGRGVGSTQ